MADYVIIGLFIGGMWAALLFVSTTYEDATEELSRKSARFHFISLCLTPLVVVAWPVVVFGGGLFVVGYVGWLAFLLARDLWKEGWGG